MAANDRESKNPTDPSTTSLNEGSEERTGDKSNALGRKPKKMGRPPKNEADKYKATYIRFHPKVVAWAKAEAKKRGVGYQSVINEALLEIIPS